MRIYLLLFLLIWVGYSCRKVVDYEVDFPGEQLVIIGTVSPHSGARVYITKSIPPNGPYQVIEGLMVTDAEVYLYSDTLIGLLQHSGDGLYTNPAGMSFQAGESYRVEVVHPDLGTAESAAVRIPEDIQQLNADMDFTGKLWPSNEPEARLPFSFRDRPGENYYSYEIRPNIPGAYAFYGAFPVGEKNFEFCGIYHTYMLDTCFDGEFFEMAFHFGLDGIAHLESGEERVYNRLRFELASLSPEYFRFLNDKRPLESGLGVADPAPTYSNVSGGLGVFMAFNEQVRILRF
jgi:hypothetical protein